MNVIADFLQYDKSGGFLVGGWSEHNALSAHQHGHQGRLIAPKVLPYLKFSAILDTK